MVCAFGLIGLYLVVIQPLGPHWALLPGDFGDSRFNNYLLEHFFRWISGLDAHYWTASFFYPYTDTIAFGDNLLGSAPIYALFRYIGLDRESAFQAWYVVGYALNFLAASYVLFRLRFGAWATGAAAFFFAFGLPVIAQDVHVQLLYRFGVPLACFFLWRLAQSPRLSTLVAVVFWSVGQFYLTVYVGVFLILLLATLFAIAPLIVGGHSLRDRVAFWPERAKAAWQSATLTARFLAASASVSLGVALVSLLWPYWHVTRLYGFQRPWFLVAKMLPKWQSYFLADRSRIWGPISALIPQFSMREEHQLFPGLAALIFAGMAVAWMISKRHRGRPRLVRLHLWGGLTVAAGTFLINGFTLYWILWALPGMDSIQAVSRIILVLMWPLAVVVAYGIDEFLAQEIHPRLFKVGIAGILSGMLVAESVLVYHATYGKAEAQGRLDQLRVQLPTSVPRHPVLIVANQAGDPWPATEIDAMLLGQEIGWPVLNGYSGNLAPAFGPTLSCTEIPGRIVHFMDFAQITSDAYYLDLINRTVPVGFDDCDPSWWTQRPAVTSASDSLSQEEVSGLSLRVRWLKTAIDRTRAQIEITNDSSREIPSQSSSGNPFQLAWRFSRKPGGILPRGGNGESALEYDVRPHSKALVTIYVEPPIQPGKYWLEVSAVQEGITWPAEWGSPSAVSDERIVIDAEKNASIESGVSP